MPVHSHFVNEPLPPASTVGENINTVPARTRTTASLGGPEIQDPHSGQTHRVLVRPLAAVR